MTTTLELPDGLTVYLSRTMPRDVWAVGCMRCHGGAAVRVSDGHEDRADARIAALLHSDEHNRRVEEALNAPRWAAQAAALGWSEAQADAVRWAQRRHLYADTEGGYYRRDPEAPATVRGRRVARARVLALIEAGFLYDDGRTVHTTADGDAALTAWWKSGAEPEGQESIHLRPLMWGEEERRRDEARAVFLAEAARTLRTPLEQMRVDHCRYEVAEVSRHHPRRYRYWTRWSLRDHLGFGRHPRPAPAAPQACPPAAVEAAPGPVQLTLWPAEAVDQQAAEPAPAGRRPHRRRRRTGAGLFPGAACVALHIAPGLLDVVPVNQYLSPLTDAERAGHQAAGAGHIGVPARPVTEPHQLAPAAGDRISPRSCRYGSISPTTAHTTTTTRKACSR
ncbi:hypothetical protein [Streptomyces sp. NPDC051162]|uniref:hypothetical protein n=1 Tax=Streptomyces sp. NPDC051162 TaxID=3154747 RepID=UPI00343D74E1